jgi:hypothetical protein
MRPPPNGRSCGETQPPKRANREFRASAEADIPAELATKGKNCPGDGRKNGSHPIRSRSRSAFGQATSAFLLNLTRIGREFSSKRSLSDKKRVLSSGQRQLENSLLTQPVRADAADGPLPLETTKLGRFSAEIRLRCQNRVWKVKNRVPKWHCLFLGGYCGRNSVRSVRKHQPGKPTNRSVKCLVRLPPAALGNDPK